jgi:serine/threonine protein kinase
MIAQIPFPNKSNYQAAMQNPHQHFNTPQLKNYVASITTNGMPRGQSGGFAVVYKVHDKKGDYAALRLFNRYTFDSAQRYDNLSKFIQKNQCVYFVDFEFLNDAITINNHKYPVLKMEWVEGLGIGDYIREHLDKNALQLLSDDLLALFLFLLQSKIAHGDLSDTNILITTQGDLKLIDYDDMFCEDTKHQETAGVGNPNFQHPDRAIARYYGEKMDHFSMWLIYASILILIEDSSFYNGNDCIIFTENDLRTPVQSTVLPKLRSSSSRTLQFLAEFVIKISENSFEEIPEFSSKNVEKLRTLDLFVKGSKSVPFNTAPIDANWRVTQKKQKINPVVVVANNAGIPNWKELIKKKV